MNKKEFNRAIAPQPLIQPSENVHLNINDDIYNESDIDVDTNSASITQFDQIIDVPIYCCGLFSLFDDLQTVNFCAQTGRQFLFII